jgi:hypothetical protein
MISRSFDHRTQAICPILKPAGGLAGIAWVCAAVGWAGSAALAREKLEPGLNGQSYPSQYARKNCNGPGAWAHLAQFGQKYFDDAMAAAKNESAQIDGYRSCAFVITKYLRAWRRGHLGIVDLTQAPTATGLELSEEALAAIRAITEPTIEILSAKTLRLTLKTFGSYNREAADCPTQVSS